jgi:hypothetical protein
VTPFLLNALQMNKEFTITEGGIKYLSSPQREESFPSLKATGKKTVTDLMTKTRIFMPQINNRKLKGKRHRELWKTY